MTQTLSPLNVVDLEYQQSFPILNNRASGTAAFLQVPMGIIETKAGWILMLGFTPEPTGAQLEEAFLRMIQSARYESASQATLDLQNQED